MKKILSVALCAVLLSFSNAFATDGDTESTCNDPVGGKWIKQLQSGPGACLKMVSPPSALQASSGTSAFIVLPVPQVNATATMSKDNNGDYILTVGCKAGYSFSNGVCK